MIFKYRNNKGEELDFSSFPFWLDEEPLLNYEWNYDLKAIGDTKSKLLRMYRNSKSISTTLFVHTDTKAALLEKLNKFFTVVESDVIAETPGKLILEDGQYIYCFITMSANKRWNDGIRLNAKEITFLFPSPSWIREATREFYKSERETPDATFLDYPYDYPYDYSPGVAGHAEWRTGHYAPSDFLMTIYGPCVDPVITINDHPYQIYTTLAANEWITLDNRATTPGVQRVLKHLASGDEVNIYDLRRKDQSVFEQLPADNWSINWSGDFGFTLTAFLERSEPEWI